MNVKKTIPFTKQAYLELQQKFEKLTKERAEVMERLKIAREQGDLSENGAYKYAKFELGDIGRQLRKIRHLLEQGEVVTQQTGSTVGFGSTVKLSSNGSEVVYTMVTQHESDPMQNKLSLESPLGQSLAGKKKGDTIKVTTPSGLKTYEILDVS